jgi:uncharacterized protein YbcI
MLEAKADAAGGQSVLQAVSNAMVRLYKEKFGRGPTKVRADFAGPDILICTLRKTLTPVERTLVELGEHQRLRDVRTFFQDATEPEFRAAVEEILGRRVVAFVGGIDATEDVAAEIFYLDGTGSGASDGADSEIARPSSKTRHNLGPS